MTEMGKDLEHDWIYWESEGYSLRRCKRCGLLEADGPGGWSEVP